MRVPDRRSASVPLYRFIHLYVLIAAAVALPCAPAPAAAQAGPRYTADSVRTARARGGMVVSENALASEIGRDVLAAGGNAVDAAVATAFALAVTYPGAGNIGGGGFMVIRFPDGRTTALDFRERAPLTARADMFLRDGTYDSELHHEGHLSVGVPGTVAGLDKAHRLYGTVPWERAVYPAVRLAEEGFPLSDEQARALARLVDRARRRGYSATLRAFSKDGVPYQAGEIHRQPDLARTLDRIMLERSDGFYRGETARLLADEMRRSGGLVTEVDLQLYMARERQPVRGFYRGWEVVSMPPPSSGGVALVEMLNILEEFDLAGMGHNGSRYLHVLAEAMRRAYRDRAQFLADPDFADVPVQRLTSKDHADRLRATIDPRRASVSAPADVTEVPESRETTHVSVVDESGMAVSLTYTLEGTFGSAITVPGAGFLLNNEMGDFNASPGLTDAGGLIGTTPNLARPQQRMLSSMTPTILARNGELVAVLGTPGGRTIINTVLQLVLAIVDFEMDAAETVAAPRIHHQWLPDVIDTEPGFDAGTIAALGEMGHRVENGGPQGRANIVLVNTVSGERVGAPDPRNPDAAAAGH
jgi:gamma-glutamyltranspeptidase/glutathione hydrolase